MQFNTEMCKVIADLEYCIGSECYNPKSDGGWGCKFRYPVNVLIEDDRGYEKYVKERKNINSSYVLKELDITPIALRSMKHKFGANELYIGSGLCGVLNYLEDRYNLDFNELEKQYLKNNAEK